MEKESVEMNGSQFVEDMGEKEHEAKDSFVNSTIDRIDQEVNGQILLTGQLNKILPFFKNLDKNNSFFYTFK